MDRRPHRLVPRLAGNTITPELALEKRSRFGFGTFVALTMACAIALFVPGCTASGFRPTGAGPGPGAACDSCSAAEASPVASGRDAQAVAAAAAADGGQRSSNQPIMMDPARLAPQTVWNRGSGPNTNSPTSTETRSQAGAPAVNQGLILPNAASASASIGDNPAVKAILSRLEDLRGAWKQAIAEHAVDQAKALSEQLDSTEARLLAASAAVSGGAQTTNVYDLRGARVSQIVANGSKSGDGPGGAISAETGKVVGDSADKVVGATMMGPAEAPATGPPSGLSEPLPPLPPSPTTPAPELPK